MTDQPEGHLALHTRITGTAGTAGTAGRAGLKTIWFASRNAWTYVPCNCPECAPKKSVDEPCLKKRGGGIPYEAW